MDRVDIERCVRSGMYMQHVGRRVCMDSPPVKIGGRGGTRLSVQVKDRQISPRYTNTSVGDACLPSYLSTSRYVHVYVYKARPTHVDTCMEMCREKGPERSLFRGKRDTSSSLQVCCPGVYSMESTDSFSGRLRAFESLYTQVFVERQNVITQSLMWEREEFLLTARGLLCTDISIAK